MIAVRGKCLSFCFVFLIEAKVQISVYLVCFLKVSISISDLHARITYSMFETLFSVPLFFVNNSHCICISDNCDQ